MHSRRRPTSQEATGMPQIFLKSESEVKVSRLQISFALDVQKGAG